MKIKLLAIVAEDGWGFFSEGDRIYLLRPPYTKENLVEVSLDIVEKAIFHHGFESCEISFDSMRALVSYIEKRFVEVEEARGRGMPSLDELRELLEFADEEILDMFLTRAETELIPQRAFGPAQAIATDLLRLDKVINNPKMRERALDILTKCDREEDAKTALEDEIAAEQKQGWLIRFPNAAKKYSTGAMAVRQSSVCRNHQLMQIAS